MLAEGAMIMNHRKVKPFSVWRQFTLRYLHTHVLAEPLDDAGFPFCRFLTCTLRHTRMVGIGMEHNAISYLQIYAVKMFDVYSRQKKVYYRTFECGWLYLCVWRRKTSSWSQTALGPDPVFGWPCLTIFMYFMSIYLLLSVYILFAIKKYMLQCHSEHR